ncbi:MAG: hypothetical protein R3F43_05715 [bacterium]
MTDRSGGCDGIGDPTLHLLWAGDELLVNDDANGTVCSEILAELNPGVYDLNVRGFHGGNLLDFRPQRRAGRP